MAKTASTMLALGTKATDFSLPNVDGKMVSLADFGNAKGYLVMFICNHCPYVIHVCDALVRVVKMFQAKGIAVIAINSNDVEAYPEDSPAKMKDYAKRHDFTFPYLFDEQQKIAKAYHAACTPDFFLFDKQRALVYRGQMDESRPGNNKLNDGGVLIHAVENMLEGKSPLGGQKPSMGCNIKWRPGNEPTLC
jgi:peroxiredoxin